MMTRCPTCPVPPGFECAAIARQHRRFCVICDPSDPEFNARIRDDVIADSTGQPRVSIQLPRPAATPSDAEVHARAMVETCDFLSGCHCGGKARCLIGAYPGPTSWPVCLACPIIAP